MDTCLICFENCENKIECGHYYHPDCIKEYTSKCDGSLCCYCFKPFEFKYLDLNKYLYKVIGYDDINLVRKAIEYGADVNTKHIKMEYTPPRVCFKLYMLYKYNTITY